MFRKDNKPRDSFRCSLLENQLHPEGQQRWQVCLHFSFHSSVSSFLLATIRPHFVSSLPLAPRIFLHISNSPVESLTGWGTPYWSTCWVASGGAGGRSGVFRQGGTSPGFPLPLFVGFRNAAYTGGGAANGVVPPVAELWHAGRAGMSCAVA